MKTSDSAKFVTLILGAGLCLAAAQARADENPFGYIYGADVLPKGKWEVEQWVTGRIGKERGDFLGTDLRTEIERGLTDRLQASLYLNYNYFYVHDAVASEGPIDNKDFLGLSGASAEFKYQVLSPYKDSFGFALYLEPGYGSIESATGERHNEIELEGKLILEKHWMEDALVGTLNYTVEPEWEKSTDDSSYGVNLKMELGMGVAYRVAPRWYAGLETRVQTEFEDADLSESAFVAGFVGPSIHYGTARWWATLTVMPQVWGWPDSRGRGGLHLTDHERLEVRLKVGFNL